MSRRKILSAAAFKNDEGTNIYNYMTILALEDGLQAKLSGNTISYSLDEGSTWTSLASNTYTPTVNSGETIMFKGNLTPNSSSGIGTFTINKKCNLDGNCMSLLFGDDAANYNSLSGKNYAFRYLFSGCTTIIQVSETFLPATTLVRDCYAYMFYGCSSLTTAPELPVTTLANNCYSRMFYGCSKLTTAPELPATTLADNCYDSMFFNCSSLTVTPELPATTLDSYCYNSMFRGCTSLTSAPELPATTLASGCYNSMFYNCSGLTTTPSILPATTLAGNCYNNMFYGCSGLTTAPELPATTLASGCYQYMFRGCSSLTTAPELPATTLASICYNNMFYSCSKLNYIKMLATDISASSCLTGWVYGVASTGTFVKNPSMTSLPRGTNGIPSGWAVVDDEQDSGNLITFTVDGVEYQAEEGMTFYEWGMSKYYDSNINLLVGIGLGDTFRDGCQNYGNTPTDCYNMAGLLYTPNILLNSVIQPISYIVNTGDF